MTHDSLLRLCLTSRPHIWHRYCCSDISRQFPPPVITVKIMVPIFAILFFVFIIALVIGLVIYNNKKEKERTLAMQQVAQQMGWAFAPVAQLTMIPYPPSFNLFNTGHSKGIKNMIYGEINGVKAAVFDYRYTVGSGKNSHTYNQSVLYFETPRLQLPMFTLSPENFMHRFISALGYQDIDFAQRPEFSKRYLLRGQDELAIRQAFNDQLLSFFETYQGTSVDAGNNQLFVFRAEFRCPAEEVQNQLSVALSIL